MQKLQPIERFMMDSGTNVLSGNFRSEAEQSVCLLSGQCYRSTGGRAIGNAKIEIVDSTGLTDDVKYNYQPTSATKSTFADLHVVFRLFWSFFG